MEIMKAEVGDMDYVHNITEETNTRLQDMLTDIFPLHELADSRMHFLAIFQEENCYATVRLTSIYYRVPGN
jgi:hypothetical protein